MEINNAHEKPRRGILEFLEILLWINVITTGKMNVFL